MFKLFKAGAIAAAVLGLSAVAVPASASLVFDDFTAVQSADDKTSDGAGVFGTQVSGGTIFGGYREVYAFKDGFPSGDDVAGVTTSVFGGRARFSSDDASYGYGFIRWDGAAVTNNATDLTTNTFGASTSTSLGNLFDFGIGFEVVYNSDAAFDIEILVYTASGKIWIAGQPVADTNNADVTDKILFSEFVDITDLTTPAGDAFKDVRAIEVLFNGERLNLGRLDMNFAPPVGIPEPGSLALAGLALLGVGVARRRKA